MACSDAGMENRWAGVSSALLLFCLMALDHASADHVPDGTGGHHHHPGNGVEWYGGEGMPADHGPRLEALRERLEADPTSPDAAATLAGAYLEAFRFAGDPWLLERAAVALAHWSEAADPPPSIALQRASLWQTEHRFVAAIGELERLVEREPRNARAWLMLAGVAREVRRHDQARRACGQLIWLVDSALGGACLASVLTATGNAAEALALLNGILRDRGDELGAGVLTWIHSLAADAAVATSRHDLAQNHFIAALDISALEGRRPELYLLIEYADFLFARNRAEDVIMLLRGRARAPSLELREADARRLASF